jgi:hypothetical protein
MKSDYLFGVGAVALLVCLAVMAGAQKRHDDEVVRNFAATRDKVVTRPTKPKPQQQSQAQARPARPIGLGCTLFMRGPRDTAIRVGVAREFREGDAVRFMIESNINGYLYVFHTENDGPAKMLFPDARLQGGHNFIQAHVPYEAPSSREEDPEFRWFHFDRKVAIERFYLVVTREPLPEVLIGERLVAHCRENPKDCPWRPPTAQWAQLLASANTAARESQSQISGQAQTAVERDRITREVGLPPGAPKPSKVKMNVSPQDGMLLMNVDLIHK